MSFIDHPSYFIWKCDEPNCDRFVAFKPHDFMDCVDELKMRGWGFIPPTAGEYGDDWEHRCPKHRRRLRERAASGFNQASRDQLDAMRAACPDNVARDIVHDNRASPTVPRSLIPSSPTSGNARGPVNTTGWQSPTPTRPPPGINYVDAQLDAQDRRDRAELIRREEAVREAMRRK